MISPKQIIRFSFVVILSKHKERSLNQIDQVLWKDAKQILKQQLNTFKLLFNESINQHVYLNILSCTCGRQIDFNSYKMRTASQPALLLLLLITLVTAQDYYSTSIAKKLTQIAAITYQDESAILNWTCDLCSQVVLTDQSIVQNDTNSVFGIIGYFPFYRRIVVAFRGSVDLANWILNLKTVRTSYPLCAGCSVHIGFNQGFNSVKAATQAKINSLLAKYPEASVMLTGHSLGGALAVMAAAHIQDKYKLVNFLYTQGQPRVGNDQFASFMTGFIPNTYRIVHYADQVPHIPQSVLGFKHSGWQIWYQRGMQQYSICPSENKACSNQLNVFQVTQADHKMYLYLELKVQDDFLSNLAGSLRFRFLRYLYGNRVFNLDMETMIQEDRQVKQSMKMREPEISIIQ